MFAVMRGKGGHRCNPDAVEFRQAFAQTMVDSFLLQPKGTNCKEDLDSFLFDLGSLDSEKTKPRKNTPKKAEVPKKFLKSLMLKPYLLVQNPCQFLKEIQCLIFLGGWQKN